MKSFQFRFPEFQIFTAWNYVDREDTAFPDVQKSYAFCHAAAWSFSTGHPPNRIEYRFHPKPR